MPEYERIEGCRGCGAEHLQPVIDLGLMPLSDGLFDPATDPATEPKYPLTVVFCPECSMVQILETVPPRVLYSEEYPYFSSFSQYLVEHARRNVSGLIERYGLDGGSQVVEVASNDGYLLQWFVEAGIPVLGVEPTPGPAAAAREKGIPTIEEFFDVSLARRLKDEGMSADVIVGNNVLAHVPDQNHFVAAMAHLLAPEGVVVMEFPYVKDLIDGGQFDTIYHEHHCYFSVTSVSKLFARHGLDLKRVEHHPVHGGSLRVYFSRVGETDPRVGEMLAAEEEAGLTSIAYYRAFADRAEATARDLVKLIDELRDGGARIAAYGAAAKGAIMLNYCGIGTERLDYVVDRNYHKHGLQMPGVHVPIVGVESLSDDAPDYLLVLAWNAADEIMRQQADYSGRGGRFILPIPEPRIV